MKINTMRDEAHEQAKRSGFWDVKDEELYRAALYARLHMIISTAMEYGRKGDPTLELAMLSIAQTTLFTLKEPDPYYSDTIRNNAPVLARLALIISEIAEAVENYFHDGANNLGEELADAKIRIGDLAGALGIDLEAEIERKMQKNRNRPKLHGKAY